MSEFFEVVFSHLSRLSTIFSWENLRLLVGAVALLWVTLALNRKLGLCLAKAPGDRFQSAGEVLSFASAARLV
jgi:hypothetical protein